MVKTLRIALQRTKNWIINNFEEQPDTEVKDLIWLKKTIHPGEKINWSFVDTVDYNIDSIPKNKELLIELQGTPKEVKKWLHSLSSKKEHSSKMIKNTITQ